MDDDDRTLAAALQQHADRLTEGLIDSSDAYETVTRRARTRRGRWMFVTAGVAAAAAVVGVLVVAGATGDRETIRSPATAPTAAPTLATSTTEPTPTEPTPTQPTPTGADPHGADAHRAAGHDIAGDVDDRHVASGAAGDVASGAADGAGCRADDRDVRGDRRFDHRPLDRGHADARHRPGAVAGLHGQRGRQRARPGPCPLRARRPAHRDPRRPGERSAGPEDRRELTQPRRATRRVIGMRVTSRSILAAGTISAVALIGAGITVFGADDPDVSGRLQPLGPSTTADNITVPRSVASSTSSTSTSSTTPPTAPTVTATTTPTTSLDGCDNAGDDADVCHGPRRLGSGCVHARHLRPRRHRVERPDHHRRR